jgi:hypothetical protein
MPRVAQGDAGALASELVALAVRGLNITRRRFTNSSLSLALNSKKQLGRRHCDFTATS